METLRNILLTQDLGRVDQLCNEVLDGTFEASDDPVTAVIVSAFINNEYDTNDMVADLDYAINQLTKARNFLTQTKSYERR